jgi:hypothetical protein
MAASLIQCTQSQETGFARRAQHELAIQAVDISSERTSGVISHRDNAAEYTDRREPGISWTLDDYAPVAKSPRRGSGVGGRWTQPLKAFEQFSRPFLTQLPSRVRPAAEGVKSDGALARRVASSQMFESARGLTLIHPPIKVLAERTLLEPWAWLGSNNRGGKKGAGG